MAISDGAVFWGDPIVFFCRIYLIGWRTYLPVSDWRVANYGSAVGKRRSDVFDWLEYLLTLLTIGVLPITRLLSEKGGRMYLIGRHTYLPC